MGRSVRRLRRVPVARRAAARRRRTVAVGLFALVAALFAVSRVRLASNFAPDPSDLPLYARYALETQLAMRNHESLYTLHQRLVDDPTAFEKLLGHAPPAGGVNGLEYPPLALSFIALPAQGIPLPATIDGAAWRAFAETYARSYRAMMAAIDIAIFALLAWLLPRLFPDETTVVVVERLLLFLLGGLALCPVLYDRLDLVLGGLLLATLALVVSGAPLWSLVLLAVGVNFKLVPLVLAPLFIVATLRLEDLAGRWTTLAAAVAARGVALGFFVVAFFVPFWLADGPHTLDFLGYHAARGIQIESLSASVVMLTSLGGLATHVVHEHGAFDLQSSLSTVLARLSPLFVALVVGALAAHFLFRVRRLAVAALAVKSDGDEETRNNQPGTILAAAYPRLFIAFVMASLMLAMAGSKVFSPQYLLWIAPLVPLAPLAGAARDRFLWAFVALGLLTTVLFPYHYADLILGVRQRLDGSTGYDGPSPLGITMLGLRNLGFVGLTLALLSHLRDGGGWRVIATQERSS